MKVRNRERRKRKRKKNRIHQGREREWDEKICKGKIKKGMKTKNILGERKKCGS